VAIEPITLYEFIDRILGYGEFILESVGQAQARSQAHAKKLRAGTV
jgi:hypothetical protein